MKPVSIDQQRVVDEVKNNLILFASAGTGKTFTVANRIAKILSDNLTTPEKVLCLTFTVKASRELIEDILSIASNASEVEVKTIHGFCYKLIVEEGKRLNSVYVTPNVCDDVDEDYILKSILTSNLPFWRLEDSTIYKNHKISLDVLSKLPVVKYGEDLFYVYNDYIISKDFAVYKLPKALPSQEIIDVCPNCGVKTIVKDGKCAYCGAIIEVSPLKKESFESLSTIKPVLRNIVTVVKHMRDELGFYSGNDVLDYQKAFDYILKHDPKKHQQFFTYYKYQSLCFDAKLADALSKYLGRLVYEYDLYLKRSNLLDFDDIILTAKKLLSTDKTALFWQNKYDYIIVDEMQDTSVLEYAVLKRIFGKNNIMFCGDYFQTIYGWRGSNPMQVLTDFERDFAPKKFYFTQNFRSTKTLTNASFSYLKNAFPDMVKKVLPDKINVQSVINGDNITYTHYKTRLDEARGVFNYLSNFKDKSCAIICRSNKYGNNLASDLDLINKKLPLDKQLRFFTYEQNQRFFKNPIVKDVFAVLKLLINDNDVLSMERLSEKYVPSIGVKSLEKLRFYNSLGVSVASFIDDELYLNGDTYYSLIEGFKSDNIVVFDTETTGLDLSKDQIIQLSAIKINRNGVILDTLDLFIEPTVPISKESIDTHGFDLTYIKAHGGVDAKTALTRFSKFVSGSVLVGHNSFNFDLPLINRQLYDNGLTPLNYKSAYDTLIIAKQFLPTLLNYKLSTLCDNFGITNTDAHNALGDITATAKCLIRLINDYIIPTTADRVEVLSKYKDKFSGFYKLYSSMRVLLEDNVPIKNIINFACDNLSIALKNGTTSVQKYIDDISEILSLYVSADNKVNLRNFLNDATLSGNRFDFTFNTLKKIPIITTHQAKGCEYDVVVLVGVDSNNFPSMLAEKEELEEEKRVFYVAITRAKESLFMTYHTSQESPFIKYIPNDFLTKVSK